MQQQQPPPQQQGEVRNWLNLDSERFEPEDYQALNRGMQTVVDHFEQRQAQLYGIIDAQQQFLTTQDQQQRAAEQQTKWNQFESAIKDLKQPELFGENGYQMATQEQQQRQNAIIVAANAYANARAQQGFATPDIPTLVQRAFRLEHADKIENEAREGFKKKVTRRSAQRTPNASRRRPDKAQKWTGPPEDDPYLHRVYAEMEAEDQSR